MAATDEDGFAVGVEVFGDVSHVVSESGIGLLFEIGVPSGLCSLDEVADDTGQFKFLWWTGLGQRLRHGDEATEGRGHAKCSTCVHSEIPPTHTAASVQLVFCPGVVG